MKHQAAARDSRFLQLTLVAFFSFALCNSPIVSAQSNTTRTRIHVADDTPDPALVAARAAMDHKDYAEAVRSYKEYLAKKPDDADAHFDLGNAYASLKQTADAKAEYEKAVSLDPKLDAAYVNLGITLMDTDPAAAIEPLQKAAALLPNEARPQFLLGWAYERSGKAPLAIEHYRAAEKLDEKNSDIHFALGTSTSHVQSACGGGDRISRRHSLRPFECAGASRALSGPHGPEKIRGRRRGARNISRSAAK